MKTAILAILLFGLLIFPHELGHFIAAKKCDVKVKEFAFGMGPVLWKKQRGETLHSIRLFPIGGFCAMEGEDESSEDPRAFINKKPWQKLIILAAGATMNFVIAIVISTMVYLVLGSATTTLDSVTPGSPADLAGIMAKDKIVAINDNNCSSWSDVVSSITSTTGEEISITVKRNGEKITYNLTPVIEETKDESGNVVSKRYVVGIQAGTSHNPLTALKYGLLQTKEMVSTIFLSLKMLFTGEASVSDMSGPVGVIQLVSETSSYGFTSYLFLLALISINVGVLNLLPLPALDGGRIIFVLYTLITKREVDEKVEGTVHAVGIILLLALSVFITFHDVFRIFG